MNSNPCILQVEDEDADINLIRFAFKRVGINNPHVAVTDGQMAVDYLSGEGDYADRKTHPLPSLVLLDLKLPKLGGMEVLAWIRQQPTLRRLVVIILSSSAQAGDLERAYELGANSFIEKPSDLKRTLEIAQLLKGWWLCYNRFAPLEQAHPTRRQSSLSRRSH